MTLTLNAYPILFSDTDKAVACAFPYTKETLDEARKQYGGTYSFYREGDNILCFSPNETYPVSGTKTEILLKDNYWLLSFLFNDWLTRS